MGSAARSARWRPFVATALLALCLVLPCARLGATPHSIDIAPAAWRIVDGESGPVNYYTVVHEAGSAFVRADYRPPMKTAVLGWKTPDSARQRAEKLAWSWRARTLPRGGDECAEGKEDSAAVVYLTWKRGLRFYTLKYVWSAVGVKGRVCDRTRNPFVAQDTIILESGAGGWRRAEIDLRAKFREHFSDGDPQAEVPDFAGIGLMSDGDQTESPSSADYGTFELTLTTAG